MSVCAFEVEVKEVAVGSANDVAGLVEFSGAWQIAENSAIVFGALSTTMGLGFENKSKGSMESKVGLGATEALRST